MTDLGTLVVNVVVKGEQAKKQMNTVAKATRKVGTDFRMLASVLRAVGGQFASATIYAAGLPGPLVAIAVAVGGVVFALKKLVIFASDSFMKFEEAVTRAGMAAGRITESSMKSLGESIMDVAATTQFTTEEIAKSAKVWLQAGRAQEDFEKGGARAVANLAAIAEISPDKAVSATVRMMEQFGAGVGHLERFNDTLAAVSTMTTATVSDLNQSMKFFGTTAAATNMSFEETVATMGRLRGVAEPGMLARGLDVAMRKIINPTEAARKAIEALGIDVDKLAQGTILDAANAFAKAGASYKDMTVIFSARAGRVMGSLVNIQKSGAPVEKLVAALSDKIRGLSAAMVKVSQTTIEKRWEILKSAAIKLGTAIGEKAAPALRMLQSMLSKLIEELSKPDTQTALASLVTGVYRIAAALVQGVIWAVKFYSAILPLIQRLASVAEVLSLIASPMSALFNMNFDFKVMEKEEIDIVREAREELDAFKKLMEEAQAEFSGGILNESDMFQGDLDDFDAMTADYKKSVEEVKKLKQQAEARVDAEERAKQELKSQLKTLNDMVKQYERMVALGPEGAGEFASIFDLDDLVRVQNTEQFKTAGELMALAIGDKLEATLNKLKEEITLEQILDIESLLKQLDVIGALVDERTEKAVVEPLVKRVRELGAVQEGLINQNRNLLNIQTDRVQEMKRLKKEEEEAASALEAFSASVEKSEEVQIQMLSALGSIGSAVASGSSGSILGALGSALSGLAGPFGPLIDAGVQLGVKLFELAGILDEIDVVLKDYLGVMAGLVKEISGPWITAILGVIKAFMVLVNATVMLSPGFFVLGVAMKALATSITYLTRPTQWLAAVFLKVAEWLVSFGGLLENDLSKSIKKHRRELEGQMRDQDRAIKEMWTGAEGVAGALGNFQDHLEYSSIVMLEQDRERLVAAANMLHLMGQLTRSQTDQIHDAIVAIDNEIEQRNKATESLREFNEEVNNLPSGYKRLKMRQLQVTTGELGPNSGARSGGGPVTRLPDRGTSYGGRPSLSMLRRFNNIFAGATGEQ